MSESLRKKLVFMTLPLALLYAGYNLMAKKPVTKPADNPAYATVAPVVTAGIGASGTTAPSVDGQALLAAPWGRDPFRFGSHSPAQPKPEVVVKSVKTTAPVTSAGWVVNGILYSDSNPTAYVNKKAVTVGDIIDNAKVLAITKTSVTLDYAGKKITISPQ